MILFRNGLLFIIHYIPHHVKDVKEYFIFLKLQMIDLYHLLIVVIIQVHLIILNVMMKINVDK